MVIAMASTTVALLMITRSTGTSLGNGPPLPVGVFAILLTTSMPWTTFAEHHVAVACGDWLARS